MVTRLSLSASRPAQAWVPLPSVAQADWTRPLGNVWTTNAGSATVRRDPVYEAQLLHLSWAAGKAPASAEITSRFEGRDWSVDSQHPRPWFR